MDGSVDHCNSLPYLGGVMDPELWFSKRCITFITMALNSHNIIVRTIINVGLNGTYCPVVNELECYAPWLIRRLFEPVIQTITQKSHFYC